MTKQSMVHGLAVLVAVGAVGEGAARAQGPLPMPLPMVVEIETQPLKVHVKRLREALEFLGVPLAREASAKLDLALAERAPARALQQIQAIFDPLCLFGVVVRGAADIEVIQGEAAPALVQQGWRLFLIKVDNRAAATDVLRVAGNDTKAIYGHPPNAEERWLDADMFNDRPLSPTLNGTRLEYRVLQLYGREPGQRTATVGFRLGPPVEKEKPQGEVTTKFDVAPSAPLVFSLRDTDGKPVLAALEIRDALGRTYPSQAKRVEPDFFFHPQIYREDGEALHLPPGKYQITATRGPEYLPVTKEVVHGGRPGRVQLKLKRWVDPAQHGWWSGDHHIHAAGCSHFRSSTEGVTPAAVVRHVRGEDLKVSGVLNWQPAFDHQKRFFSGVEDPASVYPYLIRYDVEVSGFGSHRSGHLVLLGLKEQVYPGGEGINHWPTLGLNTLRWAQKQGAVAGPAHSGWGLNAGSLDLPNYVVPRLDGIGANEYIVDVTHTVPGPDGRLVPAVDFMSAVDTPLVWELNVWYHALNAGFRTRLSGETDFPCIYGERVGLGRSYVGIDGKLSYAAWIRGIEEGRAYVGDGRSHILDFEVGGVGVGRAGSEVRLAAPAGVRVMARVAALLPEKPDPAIVPFSQLKTAPTGDNTSPDKPYWHVERARIPGTRNVSVELVVNGFAVASKILKADGALRNVTFEVPLEHSSWVALRILGTAHTNPMFVVVAGRPVCASRRSVEWLQAGVEQLWSQKKTLIAAAEMADAVAAYQHARTTYRTLAGQCLAE